MKLGPIARLGFKLDKKTIQVNTENFETNKKVYLQSEIFVLILENLN